MHPHLTEPTTEYQHLFDEPDPLHGGYYLPADATGKHPILYPKDYQRKRLFDAAMQWSGQPRNRLYSQSITAVLRRIKREAGDFHCTLKQSAMLEIAARVVGYQTDNLQSGRSQAGLVRIQAERGVKSGEARRARNEPRDNAIVKAIIGGQGIRSLAREYGLHPSTICRIRDARL